MVAVAGGEEEVIALGLHPGNEGRKRLCPLPFYRIALYIASAKHEVKVIEFSQNFFFSREGFDQLSLRVVDQKHDVRAFEYCVLPYPYSRWDP
ncbi:hypothetical protein SDC9_172406 [bioreactor metagenome]|uniref:Uncharacterized protein n=1 Tax=bioreactor metagenome TaxID=1076179 RepID=A0A645GGS8_9ZZZZ